MPRGGQPTLASEDTQPKSSGHTRRSEAPTAGPAGSRDGGSGARRLWRPLAGSGSAGFDGKALAGPSALSVGANPCSRGSTRWRPRLPRVDAGAERRPLSSGRKVKGGPCRRRRSGLREPVAGLLGAPARVPPPPPSGLELGGGWGRAAGAALRTLLPPSLVDRPAPRPERLRSARDPALLPSRRVFSPGRFSGIPRSGCLEPEPLGPPVLRSVRRSQKAHP